MENKDIKNVLGSIFDGLINAEETETKKGFSDKIESLVNSKYDLKDMEKFDVFIKYPLKKVLRAVANGLNPEVTDRNKLSKLFFIYDNYNYIDRSLANLISAKEGGGCSVDKSRWIIKSYREYIINGIIPDMTIEDRCYWKPHYGTGEQWMFFCTGLMNLYHGDPKEYLLSLMGLKNAEGVKL